MQRQRPTVVRKVDDGDVATHTTGAAAPKKSGRVSFSLDGPLQRRPRVASASSGVRAVPDGDDDVGQVGDAAPVAASKRASSDAPSTAASERRRKAESDGTSEPVAGEHEDAASNAAGTLAHPRRSGGKEEDGSSGGMTLVRRGARKKFVPPLPPPDMPFEMQVQNIVFTAQTGVPTRLPYVAQRLAYCSSELNQKRFSAVCLRTHLNADPDVQEDMLVRKLRASYTVERPRLNKLAILIFRNGKMVCTGAKTFSGARFMLSQTAQMLRDIGYKDAKPSRIEVQNMVGNAFLPCRIDQARMAETLPAYVTFDPEQFPGAIVRHPLTKGITLLVFASGRVVVTGANYKARADAALARIKPLLVHFNVNTPKDQQMPEMTWTEDVADMLLYDVLGIKPGATMSDVREAFRKAALHNHPDKNQRLSEEELEERQRVYLQTDAAYRVLSDPTKRQLYNNYGTGKEDVEAAMEAATRAATSAAAAAADPDAGAHSTAAYDDLADEALLSESDTEDEEQTTEEE